MKNEKLCEEYYRNFKKENTTTTDDGVNRIGANNHIEMIEEEIPKGTIVFYCDNIDSGLWFVGFYLFKKRGSHFISPDTNCLKNEVGTQWNNVSITNPLISKDEN